MMTVNQARSLGAGEILKSPAHAVEAIDTLSDALHKAVDCLKHILETNNGSTWSYREEKIHDALEAINN